jgi:YidC/Oxa1 family membrane protein insertase
LNGHTVKTIIEINKALYFSFLKINSIDSRFFGLDLVKSPKLAGAWYYLLIPLVTGILQYFQAQASMPPTSGNKTSAVGLSKKVGQTAEVKDKKDDSGDFQKAMNTQMKYIFPLMIGWFSYSLPIGLALYWNIFSIMGIMQYKKVNDKSKIKNSNDKK